jgi:hypothetical protein
MYFEERSSALVYYKAGVEVVKSEFAGLAPGLLTAVK